MARVNNTWWNRTKFKLNGLVIVLSGYFIYLSLYPTFPDTWTAQQVSSFEITPMPYNLEPPYLHEGVYTKDFYLIFSKGKVATIRQAYLNIGKKPLPLSELQMGSEGILHGSEHGQEVHAIAPKVITTADKMWLTIEDWQGEQVISSWDIPKEFIGKS